MEDRKKWNCEVGTHESGYTGDVASLGRFVYGEVMDSDLTQREEERERERDYGTEDGSSRSMTTGAARAWSTERQ